MSKNIRQRETVLQHDKKAAFSISVFLSDNQSQRRDKAGQPMLAFQVFEEGVEDDLAVVYVHADLAHELRNHLDAFLRYCAIALSERQAMSEKLKIKTDTALLNDYQRGMYDGLRVKGKDNKTGMAWCYKLIALNPGIRKVDLARILGVTEGATAHFVRRLSDCGIVFVVIVNGGGNSHQCFATAKALDTYPPSRRIGKNRLEASDGE